MPFRVREGDSSIKQQLEALMHEKGAKETGLQEFLVDLDRTEKIHGDWWVAFDQFDEPRGALTVRYIDESTDEKLSYLRSVWTRVNTYNDAKVSAQALISTWIDDSKGDGLSRLQADLPFNSPLIQSVEMKGFSKEKTLLTSYEMSTDWYVENLPEAYNLRPVKSSEYEFIYDNLVYPDLDLDSPIYVSKEGFYSIIKSMTEEMKETWVVVEDSFGSPVGFATSFLGQENNDNKAIMYGPHTFEPDIYYTLIGEMLTYWKSHGINKMRILRITEFDESIVSHFNMNLIYGTLRYSLEKL